jgi:1-acyl-sn-glycerol-3-phosphate acyltransferase
VIAANHYSHFDPPAIGSVVNAPIKFLALDDLIGVSRVLDWLVGAYNVIPTPRERPVIRAVRAALSALENGEVVGLFPEATLVSHWGTLAPKRGAAWLAIRAGVPLIPVAMIGTGKAMGLENRVRRSPIRVVVGKRLPTTDDSVNLTRHWSEWISAQIKRFPDSEPEGPRRAFHGGT